MGVDAKCSGEPVLAISSDASRLRPLILAAWSMRRPLAVAAPDHDVAQCARLLGPATIWRDNDLAVPETSMSNREAPFELPSWPDDECAAVIFSSGSTGVPKGIRHSLRSLFGSVDLFLNHFGIEAGETIACLAAPHVMSGFRALIMSLSRGVSVLFLHNAPEKGLMLVRRALLADWIICGPRFVQLVAACAPWLGDMPRLPRALLVTGDRLDEDSRSKVSDSLKLPVVAYYGLTETGGIVMAEKPGRPTPGLLPPACEGVTLHTRAVPGAGDKYELGIESPNNFLGYCGEPVRFHPVVWTGDLVTKTSSGGFHLEGRIDHAIKAADTTWLFPERLEKWLRAQVHVADAVVRPAEQAAGLACWVDWNGDRETLSDLIESALGHNYRPISIDRATIVRSELGKITRITPVPTNS